MMPWLRRWLVILIGGWAVFLIGWAVFLIGWAGLLGGWAVTAAAAEKPIDFDRDVRPILSDKCYKCHGPDEKERQAGLRLDVPEAALAPLESGARAIVPGKRTESALVARITHADPAERMPPADSGKVLAPAEIATLARWIDEGATWKKHWSLVAPLRPEPPAVRHEAKVRNAIDRFVLARLEAEGLEPAPEADKVTLVRRLTLDLTGLPPSPAEVDAFLADAAPDAYDKLVERLLASPRYGEHMARYWLDAVRYGDTHGLHFDNERALWKYRDWVIGAFARNLPFNQFTIDQMAGDLLPSPTVEQRVATGYNRCNLSTSEGGSIDEEVLARYAVDRVEAMSTVWLGLTTGCAVCHDHKFDPISQKEFYQLFAFFSGSADAAMDGNAIAPAPAIKLPSAEQDARKAELNTQLTQTHEAIAAALAKIDYREPEAQPAADPLERREIVWIEDDLPGGAKASADAGGWQFVAAPRRSSVAARPATAAALA